MKKIIRTISFILILILIFVLPVFASPGYKTYKNIEDYVSSDFSVKSEDNINRINSDRMIDTYNTYNATYYFYLICNKGDLSISDISFSSSFEYNIDSLILHTSFSTSTNSDLRKFCALALSSSVMETNLLTLFENSTVYIYKLSVTFKNLNYQPVLGTARDEFSIYSTPFSDNQYIIYRNQYPIFTSFSVSVLGRFYLAYAYSCYTFNSVIDVPYLSKSDYDVTNNIYNYFFLGINNTAFRYLYSNSPIYLRNPGVNRYPMRISIHYKGPDTPLYIYDLYDIGYPKGEDIILEFSPYLKTDTYKLHVVEIYNYFVDASLWNSFSQYVYFLGDRDNSVLCLPSDFDFPFYDALYKSTSQGFNNLPTYNFEDGDINIDYSQYYLQKQNWYDFGKDIYNCFIFLIFNIPLLNNVTAPLFMLLNNFIGVWSALILPLTTVGLVGAFFLFCFIYKTIKKLIGG